MGSNQPAELERLARILNYSKFIDKKLEYPIWTGKSIKVELTAETAIALSHLQVSRFNHVIPGFLKWTLPYLNWKSSFSEKEKIGECSQNFICG